MFSIGLIRDCTKAYRFCKVTPGAGEQSWIASKAQPWGSAAVEK